MSRKKVNKTKESHSQHDEELAELLHLREVVSARLDRFDKYLRADNTSRNIIQLKIRLKSVEDDFIEFDKCQTRIEYLCPEESQDRLHTEDSFYETIGLAKTIILNSEENQQVNKSQACVTTGTGTTAAAAATIPIYNVAKLPDLGLPQFHGTYDTWLSFKDIFKSVVDKRTDISDVQKFLYLKLCCRNEALKLIEPLDVTDNNYNIAWDLLEKRYDNRRAMVNHHVNNLLFKLPEVCKESSVSLRKLLDSVYQHKTALEKLNLPVQHWDVLLIPIILNKLGDRTRREWENKLDDASLPTLQKLIEFLTKKCFTLEALNLDKSHDTRLYNKKPIVPINNVYGNQQKYQSYSVTEPPACKLCVNEQHFIYYCPRFAALSISDRYNEIKNNKLCPNCLRTGHAKHECRSRGCRKCSFKHNTLLHDNSQDRRPRNDQTYESRNINHSGNVDGHREESNGIERDKESDNQYHRTREFQSNGAWRDNDGRGQRPTLLALGQNQPKFDQSSKDLIKNLDSIDETQTNAQFENTSHASYVAFNTNYSNQVLLSTATILIQDRDNNWHECNALLDSGSQSNLITQSLCNKLKIKCYDFNVPVSGINQTVTNIKKRTFANIKSRFNSFSANLALLVMPTITENLPLIEFSKTLVRYPKNINIADENFSTPKRIDILLGTCIFYDLLENGKIRLGKNMPTLQETRLGWIFTGSVNFNNNNNQKTICNHVSNISNTELQNSLTKFWQIEELPNKKFVSKQEQYCEDYFKNTTTRSDDGKFVVKFPFVEDYQNQLGNSKAMALKRFLYLETRLERSEYLNMEYKKCMRENELLDHMTEKGELSADTFIYNLSYFLPHTAVLRDSETTACRVVFDASAKTTTNVSLNDMLLVGPTIQEDHISIYVKENTSLKGRLVKIYVAIFVCLFVTRAVHLELVNDLTTDSFLNALKRKRFCSRRGKPTDIFSDNGLNFVGANNYFLKLHDLLNNEKHNETVSTFLANDQIKWHFIPGKSPNFGGLWEAAVKSTKFHLKRVIWNASLNYEEMYTLLTQIEACLNSRPLNPISNDIHDFLPLTQSHFLPSLLSSPQQDVKEIQSTRLSRYLHLQQIYQQFWSRWYKEYLSSLQTRQKWKKNPENNMLKIGSLVVLIEDNMAPLRWPMARVIQLHPGKDNIIRVISVQLPNKNIVKRAVTKICLLPVETN